MKAIYQQIKIFFLLFPAIVAAQEKIPTSALKDVNLTIHLRGVYESKLSVLPMSGRQALQPTIVKDGIKNGSTATLQIPAADLPGEFVLRFDYKEKESSTPYPSEKRMVINQQDLELWVSPAYCNNSDSTHYQAGEIENSTFASFMEENGRQKQVIGLLQQFLLNYDDIKSGFYKEGIKEYEKRREAHNQWIKDQIKEHSELFVSSKFIFQLIPSVKWEGSEEERKQSLRDHYFEMIDLNDPILVRTTDFTEWMDSYVNLYGELATSIELRDSLFTLAGRLAIENAKKGDPVVYGWMVDYFFKGYESFDIKTGIAMLEPYLNDPDCLTQKKQAIRKRLEGMQTLVAGTIAPDFKWDSNGQTFSLHSVATIKPYKLVIFWSADCNHCADLVKELYPWYLEPENEKVMDVFAVSLDDNETERKAWQQKIASFPEWRHIPTKGGVNSAEANAYFILATPVMILVDSKTNAIVAQPGTVKQLEESINRK